MAIDSSKDEAWNKQIEYMTKVIEKEEKKQQELDQYKNNWEELKKELKTAYSELFEHELINGREFIENILNIMKELEEKNND